MFLVFLSCRRWWFSKNWFFCIVCFVFHISFSFIFHYVLQVLFWKISIPFNRKPFSQKKSVSVSVVLEKQGLQSRLEIIGKWKKNWNTIWKPLKKPNDSKSFFLFFSYSWDGWGWSIITSNNIHVKPIESKSSKVQPSFQIGSVSSHP